MKTYYPLLSIILLIFWTGNALNAQVDSNTKKMKPKFDHQHPKSKGSNDGSISVRVSIPEVSFMWSHDPSLRSSSATGLKAGSYGVTITSSQSNYCSVDTLLVLEDPEEEEFIADIQTAVLRVGTCEAGLRGETEYLLTGTVMGGTPPYTSNWGPGNALSVVVNQSQERTIIFQDKNGRIAQKSTILRNLSVVCSSDPNDIIGPPGYGDELWVSRSADLNYTVRFENDPVFATAPAKAVFVTVDVPDKINPYSLKLGDFNFSNLYFNIPENRSFYQTRLDLEEQEGYFVDLTAGLDIAQNRIFWLFQTIDPATGQPPIDPYMGFLPINDTLTGSGEGFVNFTITPDQNALTGDQVSFQANIIFDFEDPILTNIWTNTIDAFAPTTTPEVLPDSINNPDILIQWTAEDDPGGVGVESTQVYLSTNSGPYNLLLRSEGISNLTFRGEPDNHYKFRFESTDFVGNTEVNPLELSTFIKPSIRIDYQQAFPDFVCVYDTFKLNFDFVRVNQVDLYFSLDSGAVFQPLVMNLDVDSFPYAWFLADSLITNDATVKVLDTENDIEFITKVFSIKNLPNVETEDAESICKGKMVVLRANGANDYYWTPENLIGNPLSPIPNAFPKQSTWFYVKGTDVFGCSNIDSVFVTVRQTSRDTVPAIICLGDSIFLGGSWRFEPGLYTDVFNNVQQCDSINVTDLAVIDPCVWGNGPIVFVDTTATGLNDGSTWVNALTNLQRALNFARKYIDVEEIWVAEGVYFTTSSEDKTISFELSDQIKMFGGFEGVENDKEQRISGLFPTVLSGDIGIFGDTSDNTFHVVKINQSCTDCVLDMIVIESGNANDSLIMHQEGAGLYSEGKASLKNIKITKNHSLGHGAAILNKGTNAELNINGLDVWQNTSGYNSFIYNHEGSTVFFIGTENSVRH